MGGNFGGHAGLALRPTQQGPPERMAIGRKRSDAEARALLRALRFPAACAWAAEDSSGAGSENISSRPQQQSAAA